MGAVMTQNNPQVPWSDEQWARVQQVVQEEASRARVGATFLPLVGPLPGATDFVREDILYYATPPNAPPRLAIDDRNIWQLATLRIPVRARGAEMADLEMTSVLALFRRAANVLARLEDAIIFNGLAPTGQPRRSPGRLRVGLHSRRSGILRAANRFPGCTIPRNPAVVPLGAPPPPELSFGNGSGEGDWPTGEQWPFRPVRGCA